MKLFYTNSSNIQNSTLCKIPTLVIFIITFCSSHLLYSQALEYDDYIKDNGAKISSIRKVDTTKYDKMDTFKAFYNYWWKPTDQITSIYYTCAYKENDHWLCLDFYVKEKQLLREGTFLNKELSIPDGTFVYYFKDGKVQSKGEYKAGFKTGLWLRFSHSGEILDSITYDQDNPISKCKFHNDLFNQSWVLDLNDKSSGIQYLVANNGNLKYEGKYLPGYVKDSVWIEYYDNGNPCYMATYHDGKSITEQCYDNSGKKTTDCISMQASFDDSKGTLKRYMDKKIDYPSNMTLNVPVALSVVKFIINEDGSISDITVLQPVERQFDHMVVKAIEKMPKWIPAKYHNKPTKQYFTWSNTFSNPDFKK